MKKLLLSFIIFFSFSLISKAQFEYVSGTIKNGSQPNSVMVVIKSSTTFTANFSNVQFMVQIPNTISPQPVATILSNPLSSYILGSYATQVVDEGGFYNYLFSIVVIGGAPFTFNAGTEYSALEIQFAGGPSGLLTDVRLGHLADGGSTSQLAFYIEMGSDYTNYSQMFFGTGASNGGNYSSYSYVPISNITLPVCVFDLNVEKRGVNVLLNWKLLNQIDAVNSFDIERSFDGIRFYKINSLTANNTDSYYYIDDNLKSINDNCRVYYRIKKILFNLKTEFSLVRSLKLIKNDYSISLFPNPTNRILNIQFNSTSTNIVIIKIYEINGVVRKEITCHTVLGNNIVQISLDDFNKGSYFVSLDNGIIKKAFIVEKN